LNNAKNNPKMVLIVDKYRTLKTQKQLLVLNDKVKLKGKLVLFFIMTNVKNKISELQYFL